MRSFHGFSKHQGAAGCSNFLPLLGDVILTIFCLQQLKYVRKGSIFYVTRHFKRKSWTPGIWTYCTVKFVKGHLGDERTTFSLTTCRTCAIVGCVAKLTHIFSLESGSNRDACGAKVSQTWTLPRSFSKKSTVLSMWEKLHSSHITLVLLVICWTRCMCNRWRELRYIDELYIFANLISVTFIACFLVTIPCIQDV